VVVRTAPFRTSIGASAWQATKAEDACGRIVDFLTLELGV
jgi:hypothetical protein